MRVQIARSVRERVVHDDGLVLMKKPGKTEADARKADGQRRGKDRKEKNARLHAVFSSA